MPNNSLAYAGSRRTGCVVRGRGASHPNKTPRPAKTQFEKRESPAISQIIGGSASPSEPRAGAPRALRPAGRSYRVYSPKTNRRFDWEKSLFLRHEIPFKSIDTIPVTPMLAPVTFGEGYPIQLSRFNPSRDDLTGLTTGRSAVLFWFDSFPLGFSATL